MTDPTYAASPAGGVAVSCPVSDVLAAVPRAAVLLTDVERRRAAALRCDADRRAYVAAHALVRLCSAHVLGTAPTVVVVQECDVCGGEHGRPRLPSVPEAGLSLAHSGGVVAAAVARCPVGVDVEPLSSADAVAEVTRGVVSAAERSSLAGGSGERSSLLMLWVRKEALVKLGRSTLDTMGELDLSELPPDLPAVGSRTSRWRGLTVLDMRLGTVPALAAAVSAIDLAVVTLDDLMASLE